MSNIFICYRREDSRADARLLYERIAAEFGADRVFKDLDKSRPGHSYVEEIQKWIDHSSAMLVLIGRGWLNAEVDGERRLEQPDDPVRREIAAALRREGGTIVIPVLVGDAPMPSKAALPADLQRLAEIDAVIVGERHWDLDVGLLIDVLHKELEVEEAPEAEQGDRREQADAERDGSQREALEREQREREQKDQEVRERDQQEQEQSERAQRERERKDQEAREREQREQEQREREQKERAERERAAREREARERKRLEREQKKREGTPPERRRAVLAAGAVVCLGLIVGALAISGVLGGSNASTSSGDEPTVPSDAIAVVQDAPDDIGTITKEQFNRSLKQVAASSGLTDTPKPSSKQYTDIKDSAIGDLLTTVWIQSEAAEEGISVSDKLIADKLAQVKKQNFKTEAEYRRFLERAGYNQQDVHLRSELQLLQTAIQRGQLVRQKGLHRFVDYYRSKWKSRTFCAPGYVVKRCENYKKVHG